MIKLATFNSVKLTLNQATAHRKKATFLNTHKTVYGYFSNFHLLTMLFDYVLLDHFSVVVVVIIIVTMCKTCKQTNDQKFQNRREFSLKRFSGEINDGCLLDLVVYLWSIYHWDYLRNFDPLIPSLSLEIFVCIYFYRFSCYSCCLPPQN